MEMLRLMAADEVPIPQARPGRPGRPRGPAPRPPRPIDAAKADRSTLNRWKVNYLRHELTRFDPMIEGLFGQIGRAAAEKLLRRRALEAIGKDVP